MIYTPPGYDPHEGADDGGGKTYRLLVLFEGSGCLDLLDNLAAQKRMPSVIMVIPYFVNRNSECECSAPFADFIAKELVPWVREHYRVTADPAGTIVGGFSYSGLAAAFCAFRHPDVFGNVITMSGSYYWFPGAEKSDALLAGEPGWLTRQFVTAPIPPRPTRFFLAVGKFEDYYPWSLLAENRRLRDVLRARGYPTDYREFTGGHDPVSWRGSLVEGLIALTRDREAQPNTTPARF
jgi:enterochelin esterase family protein